MAKIVYRDAGGVAREVTAVAGRTVMELARDHLIPGIEAECGGAAACATCHVYVDPADLAKLPAPKDNEREMLEYTVAERRPESRLSCQIIWQEAYGDLTVTTPDRQT